MLSYYNERAAEHDIVYMGQGPALQQYSGDYIKDVDEISRMAAGFGSGHLIDIACGTGFWAPHYARNCAWITFLDQSERMLSECRKRVQESGIETTVRFIRGNIFDEEMEASVFDCALIGFLLSHLSAEREGALFKKLKEILKPDARLMVIESVWSEKRKGYRQKTGIENRVLNDGRSFRVYKKYFEQTEVEEMLESHLFAIESIYVGEMLIAAVAERTR